MSKKTFNLVEIIYSLGYIVVLFISLFKKVDITFLWVFYILNLVLFLFKNRYYSNIDEPYDSFMMDSIISVVLYFIMLALGRCFFKIEELDFELNSVVRLYLLTLPITINRIRSSIRNKEV